MALWWEAFPGETRKGFIVALRRALLYEGTLTDEPLGRNVGFVERIGASTRTARNTDHKSCSAFKLTHRAVFAWPRILVIQRNPAMDGIHVSRRSSNLSKTADNSSRQESPYKA